MKRLRVVWVAALYPLIFVQGCSERQEATVSKPAPASPAPTQSVATRADVNKLETAAAGFEKQLKAQPNNADLKLKTAEADFQAGHAMMMSEELDRKVKYRGALKYFRRALALNPDHKLAAEEKSLIESIYKQMGRPIPQ
jgi:tetratricopeptide (TPR) repeat protein